MMVLVLVTLAVVFLLFTAAGERWGLPCSAGAANSADRRRGRWITSNLGSGAV